MANEFKKLVAQQAETDKNIPEYLNRAYELITLNFVSSVEELNEKINKNRIYNDKRYQELNGDLPQQNQNQNQSTTHQTIQKKDIQLQEQPILEEQPQEEEEQEIPEKKQEKEQEIQKLDKNVDITGYKVHNPTYTHQLFGDEETIYGYKDLTIDLYFTSGRLYLYIRVEYTDKLDDADDFMAIFDKWLFDIGGSVGQGLQIVQIFGFYLFQNYLGPYTTSLQTFKQELKKEEIYQPIGELIDNYELNSEQYVLYKSNENHEGFNELRVNTWPLILFGIEVASYCHTQDYWTYYSVYKQQKNQQYEFIGLVTLTEFHIDLNKKRNRISQVLITPQNQRKGHGCKITELVYKQCIQDENCLQITVEDSSPEFQTIRDIVETNQVIQGGFFNWLKEYSLNSIQIPQIVLTIKADKSTFESIKKKLKLPSFQIKRIFEILIYSRLAKNSTPIMNVFRNKIVQRIKDDMEQPKRKLPYVILDDEKVNLDVEMITQLQNKQMNQDQFYEKEAQYYIDQYKDVIKKLQFN